MFDAIIFDMDGVIVDSEPLHIKAERQTLAPFNLNIADAEFHAYMGQTPRMLIEDIIRKYKLPVTLSSLYAIHEKNLLHLYRQQVLPIEGALDLIQEVSAAKIKLGLASSSDIDLIEAVLEKFSLGNVFGQFASGEEVEQTKPNPDIFLLAAERLKVNPANCLVIEDSTNGVKAAKAAGMTCIGFNSPNSHNQNYDEADLLIDCLTDLDIAGIRVLWDAVNIPGSGQ